MRIISSLFPTLSMANVSLDDIGSQPDNHPSQRSEFPVTHRDEFASGALQRQCQEALLAHMDGGRPLASLMSNRNDSLIRANAVLALSHPCPRHIDLFAYCLELFEDEDGKVKPHCRTSKKLQWLFALNTLNLAKIIKLHGDEHQMYLLNEPHHEELARIAVLTDDLELALRLEKAEASQDTKHTSVSRMQRHNMAQFLIDTPWQNESKVRAYIHPNKCLSHVEIHARVSRFLSPVMRAAQSPFKPSCLPQALLNEYKGEGPSLMPLVQRYDWPSTLSELEGLPGFERFLETHALHLLQELSVQAVAGNRSLNDEQKSLISKITQSALSQGHPAEDIHYSVIYNISRYRYQDMIDQGSDLKDRWIKAALDLHIKSNHTDAGLAIIGALLNHEGVEAVCSKSLTDNQLVAARDITGNDQYLNHASSAGRDKLFSQDLGL